MWILVISTDFVGTANKQHTNESTNGILPYDTAINHHNLDIAIKSPQSCLRFI